jgi:hypothetical protein
MYARGMGSERAGDSLSGAGVAGAVIAAACCAGLPAAAALIGGLTATAVPGIMAGAVVLALLIAIVTLATRTRHRRSQPPSREER